MSDEEEEERRLMGEILKIIETNGKNFLLDIDKTIDECSDNKIKKKLLEFTIENLYLTLYKNSDLNIKLNEVIFASRLKDDKKLLLEKKEYINKRNGFGEYEYVKYIKLFCKFYVELFKTLAISSDVSSDVEYLELEKFNQQDNDKKNYILCMCFFDAFNNNKGADHNISLNDKINELSEHVFTRNDYYREKNFYKFKSFNIEQIKEILDLIGPKKCVMIQEKIFKEISNDKYRDDTSSYIEEICRNKISNYINVQNGIRCITLKDKNVDFKNNMERIYLNIICRKEYTFLFKDVLKDNIKKESIVEFMKALKKDNFFMKDEFVERLRLTFIENDEKNLRSDIKSFIDDKFKEIQKFKPSMLSNNEMLSEHVKYMISSFISIFNKILGQIYISNDVKKNIFEFTIQYMYKEIYLERSYFHQTFLLYKKNESSGEIIESFTNQIRFFSDGIDMKINYLMSQYLELTVSLENDKPYSDETNEEKNYNLTLCIFKILTYKFFEGYKDEIEEFDSKKASVFSRIDIQICQDDVKNKIQDYFSNIDFKLLKIYQIKEILDLIGPEKCVRTYAKILEKFDKDENKMDKSLASRIHIENEFQLFVIDRNKNDIEIVDKVTKKTMESVFTDIYKKFIYINEVKKYGFENVLIKYDNLSKDLLNMDKTIILELINKLNDENIFEKEKFFIKIKELFNVSEDDVLKFVLSGDNPTKTKSKKKKSKKVIPEEVTDEMIGSATKATDIECSMIDDEKKGKILSVMNDEIINKIRSDFFYEKGVVIFCNDDLKNPSYPKDYYSLIIFNFIKPYLLFIISFILNNDEFKKNNLNVILWGGACAQFFSKGKRRASDLDFKIYSNKTYPDMKEVLEKEMFPYLLSILDIKQILKENKPIFNEGTHSDYQTNIINAIKQLVDDDANIELKFEYYEERHIIKFNANVVEKLSSFKISLIDISLNILKGEIKLPKIDTIKIGGVEIRIIKKKEMMKNLLNYKSDYENLNKTKEYVESIIKRETDETDIKKRKDGIKKKMRKEEEGIKEEDITNLFNFVEKEEEKDLTPGEMVEKMLTNDDEKHKKDLNYFLPKYINKVPSINFTKTIEFLGKKAIDQLNAINTIKIDKISEEDEDGRRIVRKKSSKRRSMIRKKSVKKRSMIRKKSVKKRSMIRKKSVKKRSMIRKKSVKKIRN